MARAWSENAGRSLDFLISEGAEIAPMEDPGGTAEYRLHALLPTPEMVGRDSPRGTDFTLSRMWQSFLRAGGDFRAGARAIALDQEGGAVAGVYVARHDGALELIPDQRGFDWGQSFMAVGLGVGAAIGAAARFSSNRSASQSRSSIGHVPPPLSVTALTDETRPM